MGERNKAGQFLPGHKGIGGRKVGSRNKLSESFLSDLERVWRKKGLKALERVAEDEPATLVKVAASLIPRELLASMTVNATADHNIFADAQSFAEAFRLARQHIGADLPPMLEIEAAEPDSDDDGIPAN